MVARVGAPTRLPRSRPWRQLAVGCAIAAGIALVAWDRFAGRAVPLDPAVVVVTPFDVAEPALQLWRDGMVDVLARNLDGAGPLRIVSPSVVVRRWMGHADRLTVADFARKLGAGTAVYGGLVLSGTDSVQASVTLLDVRSGRAIMDVRRREAIARMGRLTDSLTVALLQGMAGSVAVGAVRIAPLASSSIEPLRPFLQGEPFFRRAQWDSAVAAYERAVTVDSAFALAWRRLGMVTSWQRILADSLAAAYLLRAGALNHGTAWTLTRKLFATLDAAARRYPNDPEVWFALGEARYHFGFGPFVGVPEGETLAAFDRAISLDSAFAPAYIHAVELGFNLGGTPMGLRYVRKYLALDPTEPAHRGVAIVAALVDPARAQSTDANRLLDTAAASALVSARTMLRRWPESAETAVRLSRKPATGRPSPYPLFADTGFMRQRLAEELAFRGHFREAASVLGTREVPLFAELAYLGAIAPDTARAVFARWLGAGSPLASLALPWWASHRDTASITTLTQRAAARVAATRTTPYARLAVEYQAAAGLAHLALARGDTATALARLVSLPDTLCGACYLHRFVRARLLLASGRAG